MPVEDGRRGRTPLWAEDAWAPTGLSRTPRESDHQLYRKRNISACPLYANGPLTWARCSAMASENRTSDRASCILRRCSTSSPMGSSICWAMDASQWSSWVMAGTCLSSCRVIRSRFNALFVVVSSLEKASENDYVSKEFSGKDLLACLSKR